MKKKVLSMALVSAMAVSLFGGVTVSAEESEIGGSLIIWEHTDQFTEPLKSVVEGFNELYPDVDVQIEVKTSDQYYNLLQTAMQAGETPDLFWTNGLATTHYKSYVDAGYLMDLTDVVFPV